MNGLTKLILIAFKCVMIHVVKTDDVECGMWEKRGKMRREKMRSIMVERKRKEGKEKENVSESIPKNIEMISSLF